MQTFGEYIEQMANLVAAAARIPLGQASPCQCPAAAPQGPCALLFSPHPDDECITGLLPLRLMREAGWRVINVPVTHGSLPSRRAERHAELAQACHYLGWQWLERAAGNRFTCQSRPGTPLNTDPAHWEPLDGREVCAILEQFQPAAIFVPHDADWNARHISTHTLVLQALAQMQPAFHTILVETEFWGAMTDPNFMVAGSPQHVTDLVTATSFHVKEVARNPYHILLPAWMLDNVRRGGELVGGQGQAAPAFTFATLYRVRAWNQQQVDPYPLPSRFCTATDNIIHWFPTANA